MTTIPEMMKVAWGKKNSLPAGTDVERKQSATVRQQLALLGAAQRP